MTDPRKGAKSHEAQIEDQCFKATADGRDLMPVFYAMMNWGFKYEEDNEKKGQE